MDFSLAELHWLMPEIFVLTMGCIILLVDAYVHKKLQCLTYQLTQATIVGAALLTFATVPEKSAGVTVLHNMFVQDQMSVVLKSFIYLITFGVFLYSRDYLRERELLKGEYLVLGLFAMLGMLVMVSAHNLLVIYLGLELLSLSLYAMVAMHRNSIQAAEAAMKYFVLGALASGMLLYGMSMLYGAGGSLDLALLAEAVKNPGEKHTLFVFGLIFVLVGVSFKFGAVPFHMWVPDVYQGAPTATTLFIGSAPKLAAFAMLIRLFAEGMAGLSVDWQQMLIILSVLSMAVGNIVAIAQINIKRMLAYSTISHVGFLMLGVLTATDAGYAAAMFYVIVYALMGMAGFGMILLLSRAGFEADQLDDFKGLNDRSPWYALIMMIVMLSMAGMPPLLGFWAKWSVLSQVVRVDLIWLAVVAVIFSVIGAFYYLRVIKLMYFDKAEDQEPIKAAGDMHLALSINGLLILVLGLFPQRLMEVCLMSLGWN